MTSVSARPPHRRERLSGWMKAEDVTCAVLFGADHVAHLTGYARYFGGPSAVIVGDEGDCVLVVMQDEAPVARSAVRVAFWGALAMAVTAGVGRLFGAPTG